MRALLVLLILAALGVGGYFAFQSSDKTKNPTDTSLENDTGEVVETDTTGTDTGDGAVDLKGFDQNNERTATAVDTPLTEGGQATITTNPDSETGQVTGRVVNSKGEAVSGAKIVLTQFGGASMFFAGPEGVDRTKDLTTTSAGDGAFAFDEVPPFEMYTLVAEHDDYARSEVSPLDLTHGAVITQELTMGKGARLFGAIRDVQGNAVGGATLQLQATALGAGMGDDPGGQKEIISDSSGAYEYSHCAPGNYVLTVAAEGYGQATIQNLNISGAEDVERNVELDVAQLLAGRVVDENNKGIAKARVDAFLIGNQANRTRTQAICDKDGNFEFQDVGAGTYSLRASAKEYKSAMVNRANAGEMDVEIRLVPLPTVSGQVLDAQGNPVTDFTINLRQGVQNSDMSMPVAKSRKKIKDPEGRYTLTLPNAGEYMTEAQSGRFAPTLSDIFTVTESPKTDRRQHLLERGWRHSRQGRRQERQAHRWCGHQV